MPGQKRAATYLAVDQGEKEHRPWQEAVDAPWAQEAEPDLVIRFSGDLICEEPPPSDVAHANPPICRDSDGPLWITLQGKGLG